MNKFIRGTLIGIGSILCLIVIVMSTFVIAQINDSTPEAREVVKVQIYNLKHFVATIGIIILLLAISLKAHKIIHSRKIKIVGISIILIIYILLQIKWINKIDAFPVYDQEMVYDAAVLMYENKTDSLTKSQYLEVYPQQLNLATIYFLIFKIFNSTNVLILQYINAIANAFTILAILLIAKHLGKEYNINKFRTLMLSILFVTLPLLSTFMYGDILSMPMCLFAIYFIMKYSDSGKTRFAIISILLMALAYIARMNNLIYIIALTIYLFLDIIKVKVKNIKQVTAKTVIIILFVVGSILPATLLKTYWQNRLQLNNENKFPSIGFICMGMREGERANGWYNNEASWAYQSAEIAKMFYNIKIRDRINYFISNPGYFVEFYTLKIATMWTENTYASLWYNKGHNFGTEGIKEITETKDLPAYQTRETDEFVDKLITPVQVLQKGIVLIIFTWVVLVMIKYRQKVSNEILLLVTVFIGGFLFHIIWEAKSRYIIPYIIVLIPISAISLDGIIKNTIKNIKSKVRNEVNNETINSNSNL